MGYIEYIDPKLTNATDKKVTAAEFWAEATDAAGKSRMWPIPDTEELELPAHSTQTLHCPISLQLGQQPVGN